jgi:hypothetical protein
VEIHVYYDGQRYEENKEPSGHAAKGIFRAHDAVHPGRHSGQTAAFSFLQENQADHKKGHEKENDYEKHSHKTTSQSAALSMKGGAKATNAPENRSPTPKFMIVDIGDG